MDEKSGDKEDERSWPQFTEETSMHGIKFVTTKRLSGAQRITWLLLILIGLTYFCYAATLFLTDMHKRTISTRLVDKRTPMLQLPTVTICNRNQFRRSKMENQPHAEYIEQLLTDFYTWDQGPPMSAKFNWTESPLNSTMFTGSLEHLIHDISNNLTDMIVKFAIFQGNYYTANEAFTIVETDAGLCAQFNGNGSHYAIAAGLFGGIMTEFDTKTLDYAVGPFSHSEGYSIVVHDSDTVPLVQELGIQMLPGTDNTVQVERTEILRQPPPADDNRANCFDNKTNPNPLHYHTVYSYSGCVDECKTSHIIRKCGCRSIFNPAINGTKMCNFRDLVFCVRPEIAEYKRNLTILKDCDCRSTCYEVKYSAKVSAAKYPSKLKQLKRRAANDSSDFPPGYSEGDKMLVNIYYPELSYQRIEEVIEYGLRDLIANIGGTLGVCIGASFLTLCEFVEQAFTWLAGKVRRKNKGPVNIVHLKKMADGN